MLAPPQGLDPGLLISTLADRWQLPIGALEYLPVGWGSHHWAATDATGGRWFVTVDELDTKRWSEQEPLATVFDRVSASLSVAVDLAAHGLSFVVAPAPAHDGQPVLRLGERFSLAVHPFVVGESFSWGEFSGPEHRLGVLELLVAMHTAAPAARRRAQTDDLSIAFRDALEASLSGAADHDRGPYAVPTAELLAAHGPRLRALLARYDELVRLAAARSVPAVLTHGEPHPGNTMRTQAGWLLIDWDTALIAAPERDLWDLDPGDGSVFAAYQLATGVTLRPPVLELYRLRWELTDLAMAAGRFRAPHSDGLDDTETFELLDQQLRQLARPAPA